MLCCLAMTLAMALGGCGDPSASTDERTARETRCSACGGHISPFAPRCPLCGAPDPTGYYDQAAKATEPAEFTTRESRATARDKQRQKTMEEIRKIHGDE